MSSAFELSVKSSTKSFEFNLKSCHYSRKYAVFRNQFAAVRAADECLCILGIRGQAVRNSTPSLLRSLARAACGKAEKSFETPEGARDTFGCFGN
jgi:hypothetical protein